MIPFLRTICDCSACVSHCRRMPAKLGVGDVDAIAEHLGITRDDALQEHFTLGRGVVGVRSGAIIKLATIVPKRGADGACKFLVNGRCAIHDVSPFGCRFYDDHMPAEEADRRSNWWAHSVIESKQYKNDVRTLADVRESVSPI